MGAWDGEMEGVDSKGHRVSPNHSHASSGSITQKGCLERGDPAETPSLAPDPSHPTPTPPHAYPTPTQPSSPTHRISGVGSGFTSMLSPKNTGSIRGLISRAGVLGGWAGGCGDSQGHRVT